MFKKFLMGLVCLSLVAMVGCGGGGGGSSHTPTQDIKEAIKGKWYLHSRDDLNFHTGDDDKVSYVEIKDNSIEATEYDWDENCVFGGESATITGTWKYENSILTVTWTNLGVKNYEVNLQNEILTLTYETLSGNMRASANTVIDKFKKTKPAKYQAPAISEEALKGKWYIYSVIDGDNPEAYYYSSNDGKAAYIDIKDNKKCEFVNYNYNSESEVDRVFTGDPSNVEGTWRLEDNLLIFTIDGHDTNFTVISVDDETLITLRLTDITKFKFKKNTPPVKYQVLQYQKKL